MTQLWKKATAGVMVTVTSILLTGCGERLLILRPAGPVARIERSLIFTSAILTLIVVVPVIVLMFYIVYRYRDTPDNHAPYRPDWSESRTLEIVWWGIPILIIAILGTLTVRDTFRLVRPPASMTGTPLTVHVTSLNWKWLFQYPDQNIATVNYVTIPAGRPVRFILTSNAPMNSFWVPQLGGQEYTMPGMAMRLWLQADHPGSYFGSGANFTGRGYAHMKFNVVAKPEQDFQQWIQQVKTSAPVLTKVGYKNLSRSSIMGKTEYSAYPSGSFERTVKQEGGMYMKHKLTEGTD